MINGFQERRWKILPNHRLDKVWACRRGFARKNFGWCKQIQEGRL